QTSAREARSIGGTISRAMTRPSAATRARPHLSRPGSMARTSSLLGIRPGFRHDVEVDVELTRGPGVVPRDGADARPAANLAHLSHDLEERIVLNFAHLAHRAGDHPEFLEGADPNLISQQGEHLFQHDAFGLVSIDARRGDFLPPPEHEPIAEDLHL